MQEPVQNRSKSDRSLYFDVMNILACISVLILHHNNAFHSYTPGRSWVFSLAMECAFYWAVPIFLMISGANLLGYHKKYSTGVFFRKRFARAFFPWLIWSIIVLFWKLKVGTIKLESHNFPTYFNLIFQNQVESRYWFFSTLFSCYLLLPILTYLTEHKPVMWYTLIIALLYHSIEPMVQVFQPLRQSFFQVKVDDLILYFLLGWLLNDAELSKKQRIGIYLLGIAAVTFRFVYTYVMSAEAHTTNTDLKGYKMFHAVALAAAVFVFLKNVDWEKLLPQWLKKALPKLASYSLGVYLIHSIVMYYEQKYLHLGIRDMVYKTLCIPLTYFICILIIALLKKVPFIGKYIC